MTNEETTLDENEKSTLGENAESEDTSDDLNDIFSDIDEDADDVDTLKEKIARLEKGIQKLATQKGQEKKEVKETVVEKKEEEIESGASPVLKNLYIKSNPEAEMVWDEVEKEAKALGKDPFELYESSSYFKGEAKSRYDAKTEEETNKSKIDKPSGYTGGSKKFDPSKVAAEDVVNLKPHEKAAWISLQAERERNRDE